MERQIKIIPCIYGGKPAEAAKAYDHSGADAVGYYDEKITAETVKEIAKDIDIPLYAGGGIEDLEDVKKILYAGADKVCLGKTVLVDKEIVKKAGDRFGKDQIIVSMGSGKTGRSRILCEGNGEARSRTTAFACRQRI